MKRILSMLLVAAMLMGMLPVSAMADEVQSAVEKTAQLQTVLEDLLSRPPEPEIIAPVVEEPAAILFSTYGDFTYSVANETATITGYTGVSGEITIPAEVDGYVVTAIGPSAFQGGTALTEVNLPDSIISIGEYAFEYCSNLTVMELPSNLETLVAARLAAVRI